MTTPAPASKSDLIRKYQTIFDNNGLGHKKITDVILTTPNLIGEHMASECTYVTLKLADGEPDYEIFVKSLLKNFEAMNLGEKMGADPWNKEQEFFNIVLKDLQAYYMKNSGASKPLDFFPKCLYADRQEIIMENLVKMHGYHMNSKEERQNLEFATMALDNLAQYHAVTYAMVKEAGGHEAALQKYPCMVEMMYSKESPFIGMLANAKITAIEIMNNNNVPGMDIALRVLEKEGTNLIDRLVHEVSPKSKNLCYVMDHGDFWNNNMMFLKDPVTGKLKHNVIVDFQVGRIGSPNLDVAYFMYTSVRPELRKNSWKLLLASYYKKLSTTVELLTKSPFPHTFEEFVADFKTKSILGFWMNVFVAIIMEVIATIDPSKMEGDPMEYFQNAINKWLKENPEKGRQRAMEIVDICDEYEKFVTE